MASLLAESWTWYGVVVLVLISRYISRYLQLGGITRYQTEDYVMLFVFVTYTTLVSCMNIVASLDTNLMLPEDIPLLTPASIQSRIRGSKLVLVVEQSMLMTIWGCKICLLLIYRKLTLGLKQKWAVVAVASYVGVGFVVMEILYLGVWCRPFNQYWAVPVANEQCSAALHHLITNTILNISSDLMMLCIPLPLLVNSKLPLPKKLILCSLFGLAIFVIMCAILSKYYSFMNPFSAQWTFWYIREASTAILVANIPMCWSLLRRIFNFRSFNASSYGVSGTLPTAISGRGYSKKNGTVLNSVAANNVKRGENRGNVSWWEREGNLTQLGKTESEENIVNLKPVPLEIWASKQFDVDSESVNPASMKSGTSPDGTGEGYHNSARQFSTQTTIVTAAQERNGTESDEK